MSVNQQTQKKRRNTRACDRCHKASIKCSPDVSGDSCSSCAAFGCHCTYDRPRKRRGPPPKISHPAALSPEKARWSHQPVASHSTIVALCQVFHHVCYPIFPYFHWPSFAALVDSREYDHHQSFFTLVMAVCADASARVHDGAQIPPTTLLNKRELYPPSELFYHTCLDSMQDMTDFDFHVMRAEAILGLLCLQYNDLRGTYRHIHRYLGMSAEIGFHNEARWPSDLDCIAREERRRLFWQQYQLDVYLAVTFGSAVRHREAQFNVRYPTEVVDDEDISADGVVVRTDQPSFLRGWNFVVDLYRILEHVNDRVRDQRPLAPTDPEFAVSTLFAKDSHQTPSTGDIFDMIQRLYDALPNAFKETKEMIGDPKADRFAFQAANIVISMTTVKMALVGSEEQSVPQRCAIASELLSSLSTIPASYIRSSSTAMLHHLAGVGHLLGSVIQRPISQWKYLQVRSVLLAMADLISTLESGYIHPRDIAGKVRTHVQRIDRYMEEALMETGKVSG
ncbi:fungal-specific transcription factor domain-domain-containing protein [Kockovaella imperatae]|uniref:Fungal-specific transcription factor domain-domain-containing protein n=1 Tax=Kockovaella imperatae TaxID=4999 RepID=A0A1Y1UBW7_9TREE|nr:fungal-specific transcription factor domain-domain-containing protein [Kockovaella imperatae]ORX35538.1 fungal-specific transcription factor domain-domain-containing protein [Kockovaella imperatae]